jgi:pimeloyl-ACP methyl ester carboxylesterase
MLAMKRIFSVEGWRKAVAAVLMALTAPVLLVAFATPTIPVSEPVFPAPASLAGIDEALAAAEAKLPDLRPGSDRRIVWADPARKARTRLALVYLHGFTATRQEVAPVADRAAAALGANLYYARVPGHGRTADAMAEATLASWQLEGMNALAIGRLLGERVVLMGTSTGGTLATWLAAQHPDVAAVVLISPNYAVQAAGADLAALPGGQGLVRLVQGSYREYVTHGPLHAAHWTARYSTMAIPPMMRLVKSVDGIDPASMQVPVLAFYSPRDTVVRPEAIEQRFARWGSSMKRLVAVETQDPDRHVLAGDALSPGTSAQVTTAIVEFVGALP